MLRIRDRWRACSLVFATVCVLLVARAASAQTSPTVTKPTGFALSPPLSDIQDFRGKNPPTEHVHRPLPNRGKNNNQGHDDALQTSVEPLIKGVPHTNFAGVGASGDAPPDTNIAVGPHHIVETVNAQYAIYDHNGALLLGPKSLSSLWSALGGACGTNNAGDPVVQYDKLADRWLITQMGSTASPYSECIAVSQTSDPAGAYYLYSYAYNATQNDYPKFGVWPTASNSAYLATYNLFASPTSFTGGQLCAYDRAAMLSGAAAPTSICSTIPNDGGFLPADLDGPTAPLDGTPGYFLTFETLSSLRMYQLSPNFANPAASVLTQVTPDLTVAAFNEACGGGTCIPQSSTSQQLDSLGDRLMYRLAFRVFADHEAMVVNHSVAAGSTVGVRWYELRAPVSSMATFSVFQQGTFAPDLTYRWMGSAAMDQAGNIAMGYSASSSNIHPAIRYTGRAPSDPPGTLASEASLIEGTGSQTGGLARWGDYTAMRIDPLDDCTFWYSNEYLSADGSFNWSTFIGSFKLAGCPGSTTPVAPVISNVSAGSITSSGAVITWPTDQASDSQVAYGATSAYGSTSTLNSTLVTAHSVNLTALTASTTYHYQVLSRNAQGVLSSSTDFNFTTAAAPSGPPPLLQFHADVSEVSGVTNGSIVTPGIGPAGFTGTVVAKGTGSVNFAPAQVGNGVYFLNCCTNTNNAYYKFTSAAVGNIFNVNQGQISFYLKSRYSFAQRQTSAAAVRYAFDVRDANGHLFYFLTQVTSGYLEFVYQLGGASQYYYVPKGTEDTLYGSGVVLKVTLTWDGATGKLYFNDALVKSTPYTIPAANWTAASNFDLGAYEYLSDGGYNASDDIIDEFTVTAPAIDTTPPVVAITAPSNGATVSGTVSVSANATDNMAVTSVQFKLDGVNLGGVVTGTGPTYTQPWDTTKAANGSHTLAAAASDAAGNTTTSSSISVTVSNTVVAPVITNVSAGSITSSGAVITWSTDQASDSQVAYGATSAYGSTSTLNSTLVTAHSVNLSGLAASTTYHYQVLSRNSQGILSSSTDVTFTTAAAPSGPPPLLQFHADASEVSGVTNGSIVTPGIGPAGFTGTVVAKGTGSVNDGVLSAVES